MLEERAIIYLAKAAGIGYNIDTFTGPELLWRVTLLLADMGCEIPGRPLFCAFGYEIAAVALLVLNDRYEIAAPRSQ